uniref:Cellular retinoic acid binding protein 2, b n=1 Tax=Electrophorus electricus TaxID=8005 RepID=A0A4W4EQC0_ELEEL
VCSYCPTHTLRSSDASVNVFLRKIAVAAASRPLVEITQQGETLSIQTSTSVHTTHISFTVGQSFNEATVDGRPCMSFPKWETDRKITCEQTLQKGEGPPTCWTRELTSDRELILVRQYDVDKYLFENTSIYIRYLSRLHREP